MRKVKIIKNIKKLKKMEKRNAKELSREYRSELLANIKAAECVDLVTFRQLVGTLDIKYLGKVRDNKNFPNMILFNLKKQGLVEIVREGREALISVKEKDQSQITKEEAKEVVKSVLPPKEKIEKKRVVSKKTPFKKEDLSLNERIINVVRDSRETFTYPELTEVMRVGFYISTQYLISVNKHCIKNYGLSFGEIDSRKRIFTKNPGLRFLDEIDKISIKDDPVMEVEPLKEEEQPEKVVDEVKELIPEVDFETAYIRFAVAGILKSLENTVVVISKLADQLKEYFEIDVDPRLLILSLKEEHEFTLIDGGKKVGLRSDKSWKIIKEKYNPRQYTMKILARISMTKEEVESYFENAEVKVISAIKYADNIYELTVDRSVHTRKQVLKLYKSFRGTDKILEEDMDNVLQKYVKDEENRAYRFYCPLEIENM